MCIIFDNIIVEINLAMSIHQLIRTYPSDAVVFPPDQLFFLIIEGPL